jgi:hypothetical protein
VSLWTWKFALSLAVVALFLLDALLLRPDPVTGHARHALSDIIPYMDSGIASFAFLFSVLYIFSHGWQCAKAWVRGERKPEPVEPRRRRKRKR